MSESTPKRKAPRSAWKPGQSGNPGGAPKGKKISTWMMELGQMTPAELKRLDKSGALPINGQIALARIFEAVTPHAKNANAATSTILERTEGKVAQPVEGEIKETRRIVLIFPGAEGDDGGKETQP